jgi:hypothetical protein
VISPRCLKSITRSTTKQASNKERNVLGEWSHNATLDEAVDVSGHRLRAEGQLAGLLGQSQPARSHGGPEHQPTQYKKVQSDIQTIGADSSIAAAMGNTNTPIKLTAGHTLI